MKVLVLDIGGSSIKMAEGTGPRRAEVKSSPDLTPHDLVRRVREAAADWEYDAISIGIPGRVNADGPVAEPGNLGSGWVGFDFEHAFGRPCRIVNDAVLQALGAYDGSRMLFLGLGTGLGSTIVTEHVVVPMELGELRSDGEPLGDRLGRKGLERDGLEKWRALVLYTIEMFRRALLADYVVLGGGNASQVGPLPADTRCGGNEDAIAGGNRLWREFIEPHDRPPSPFWRVLT